MPRRLQTIWRNNRWELYDIEEESGAGLLGGTRPIPIREDITGNPAYQYFRRLTIDDINAGLQGEAMSAHHTPGYWRNVTVAGISYLVALLAAAVVFARYSKNIQGMGTIEALTDPIALTAILGGFLLLTGGIYFTVTALRTNDHFQRKKIVFETLLKLENRLAIINDEVAIKDEAIDGFIEFLLYDPKNRSSRNISDREKLILKDMIAPALDKKNDLNLYKNIAKNLQNIRRLRHVMYGNALSKYDDCYRVVLVLVKSIVANRFYGLNKMAFAKFNMIDHLGDLSTECDRHHLNVGAEYNFSLSSYVYKTIGDLLEDYEKLIAVVSFADMLEKNYKFNIQNGPEKSEHSVVRILYEKLSDSKRCEIFSLNVAIFRRNKRYEGNLLSYLNSRYNKNFKSILEILEQSNSIELEAIISDVAEIFSSNEVFYPVVVGTEVPLVYHEAEAIGAIPALTTSRTPELTQTEYVRLKHGDHNLYFRVEPQAMAQRGWNCGDIALGIERNKWLEQLRQAPNETLLLLAPELKAALILTAVLLNAKQEKPAESEQLAKETELNDLLNIFKALKGLPEQTAVERRIRELTENNKTSLDDLERHALPPAMQDEAAIALLSEYQKAHEDMLVHFRMCNDKLNLPEGNRKSMQGLEQFFKEKQNQENHQEAYQAYLKAKAIIDAAEVKLNAYCQNIGNIKRYIDFYYGNRNWLAYQPVASGEGNTCIFHAISQVHNLSIYIYRRDPKLGIAVDQVIERPGCNAVHILYNGSNHFVRLITITEDEYKQSFPNSGIDAKRALGPASAVILRADSPVLSQPPQAKGSGMPRSGIASSQPLPKNTP